MSLPRIDYEELLRLRFDLEVGRGKLADANKALITAALAKIEGQKALDAAVAAVRAELRNAGVPEEDITVAFAERLTDAYVEGRQSVTPAEIKDEMTLADLDLYSDTP